MFQTINEYQFRDAFRDLRPDNFTYQGLGLLFEYFEQIEDETGTPVELDVITICCEYAEDTVLEIARAYSIDMDGCEDEDKIRQAVQEYLEENTTLVGETDAGFVYAIF